MPGFASALARQELKVNRPCRSSEPEGRPRAKHALRLPPARSLFIILSSFQVHTRAGGAREREINNALEQKDRRRKRERGGRRAIKAVGRSGALEGWKGRAAGE
jgi:hypothetical protein